MKKFYKKLIETFEKTENLSKFTAQEITPVTYIDIYAQQDQFEENFELFSQPALLVDWNIGSGNMEGARVATITFYCCYEQLRDTSNISLNRELGLKFLDYVAIIDEIAMTIESETTGKLDLVSEGFHKMDSIVDIYILTYECSYHKLKNPRGFDQEGDYDKLVTRPTLEYDMD